MSKTLKRFSGYGPGKDLVVSHQIAEKIFEWLLKRGGKIIRTNIPPSRKMRVYYVELGTMKWKIFIRSYDAIIFLKPLTRFTY